MQLLPHHKKLARHFADCLATTPQIRSCRWADEPHDEPFDLAAFAGAPRKGITTFVTIGLSDAASVGGRARFEIAGACASRDKKFAEVLMFAAHVARTDPGLVVPRAVREKLVATRYSRASAAHVFFSEVPLLGVEIVPLAIDEREVRALYAVPITSDELLFLQESGPAALEEKLRGAELSDLDRASRCAPRQAVDFGRGMTMWRGKPVPTASRSKR